MGFECLRPTVASSIYCPSNCRKLKVTAGSDNVLARSQNWIARNLSISSLIESVDSQCGIVEGQRTARS